MLLAVRPASRPPRKHLRRHREEQITAGALTFTVEVITLPVSDVDRALRFYADRLGFPCSRPNLYAHGKNGAPPRDQRTGNCPRTIGAMMGLSWQQGPLGRDPNGTFLTATAMPARILYIEPLRRRMSVELAGSIIARSDGAVILFEPARYPVAYFPIGDIDQGVLQPAQHESVHPDLGTTAWFDVVGGDGRIAI